MIMKNLIIVMGIIIILFGTSCNINKSISTPKKEHKSENVYNFENIIIEEKTPIQHTVEEVENFYREISNISNSQDMKEVVITVNKSKITRGEFEARKMFNIFQYNEYSTKEIVHSLIKPLVIISEAKKLNLEPSQDRIDEYMYGIRYGLSNHDELTVACLRGRGITEEDYLEEQEKNAYEMFQREALYEYIEENSKNGEINKTEPYTNVDKYVSDLLKYANIKFYDSEIEKACLEN